MKKLIWIFILFAFAIASLSVVACGKKAKVSTDDDVLTTKLLIEEFKAELKNIVYNHLDEVRPKLIRQSDEDVVDFFNRDNITNYGINMNQPTRVPKPLEKEQTQDVIASFNNLINSSNLKKQIEKLAANTDKYSILINENKIVKDIIFDTNSFAMIYVDDETFLANASILLVINYNYLDYNRTIVNAFLRNYINLGVTGDSSIKTGIASLENNLANDLVEDGSSIVWNKGIDFNYQANELYQAFELYNDQKRSKALERIFSKEVWQIQLSQFITDKKYFGNNSNLDIELDFSSKEIKDDRVLNKIEPITHISTPKTYQESLSLRQTFLQKYQANDDLSFLSGTLKGDREIYDILNSGFKKAYIEFKSRSQKYLTNYQGHNLNKDNILLGEVIIDGLALNFKNLNFSLPINTFTLKYSLSLKGNDFDITTNNALNQSLLGEAVYKNCVAGIKSFQTNFGIEGLGPDNPKSRFKKTTSGKVEYLRVPLVFTGTKKSNPLNVNIFENLKRFNLLTGSASTWHLFNNVLSLETDNLLPVRYNLLNEGYQGTFGFGIKNLFRKANFVFEKNLFVPDSNAFISMWLGKAAETKNQDVFSFGGVKSFQSTAKKYVSFNMGFEINFSLLNIYVSLPEINYGLGTGISLHERPEYQYAFGYSLLMAKV